MAPKTSFEKLKLLLTQLQFESHPFRSRLLAGILFAIGVNAFFLAVVAILVLMGKMGGSTGGAGGIIGFIVAPIAMLAGAPWSFIVFNLSGPAFPLGIIAGVLINGTLIGAVWGLVAISRRE